MAGLKTLVAIVLMSTIPALSALAQEPAAFQALYPNRDVLNGGALTPAGRLGLELPFGAAPSASFAGVGAPDATAQAVARRSHAAQKRRRK